MTTLHDITFGDLVVYWLKGIAQVFLVNSWVTGIFFLVALALCSRWATPRKLLLLFQFNGADISAGLMGFSPVLTGIAVGMTFYKPSWRSALWSIAAIIATVFIQAGMDAFMMPLGIPTLTGPFCIATWLFMLPAYKLNKQQDAA